MPRWHLSHLNDKTEQRSKGKVTRTFQAERTAGAKVPAAEIRLVSSKVGSGELRTVRRDSE